MFTLLRNAKFARASRIGYATSFKSAQQFCTEAKLTLVSKEPRLIFAVDDSGSTSGNGEYWRGVGDVLKKMVGEHPKSLPDARLLFWNDKCKETTMTGLQNSITKYAGSGYTQPQTFAQWIINKRLNVKPIILYLITDGQIAQGEVDELGELVPLLNIAEARVCIFGYMDNLSVSAAFTRNCLCKIEFNGLCIFDGDTNIDFEKQYYTVDSFLANFEKIKQTVMIANMGIDNEPMRQAILKMKKVYLAEVAKTNAGLGPAAQALQNLVQSLEANSYPEAMKHLRTLLDTPRDKDKALEIEQKVSEILNLCSLKGQFHRSAILNTNRANWADNVASPEEVEEFDVEGQKFEFPIILDKDVPVLLISNDFPILTDVEKSITDDLVSCPLTLLKYADVVEKLKTRISRSIGHYGFRELFAETADLESSAVATSQPRHPLLGGIPLGCDEQHVRVGDYVLSKMFTGGKLLGNPTLWLCAVYFVIRENSAALNLSEEFMDQFRQHLIFRLKTCKTFIGLSGLPQYPLISVPIGVALWYCVVSSELIQPHSFECERLLQHFGISPQLMHLLDILQYPYDREATAHRATVRKTFSRMLRHCKEVDSSFKAEMRSFYQRHMVLGDGKYIFLDGHVTTPTTNRYSDRLPLGEIMSLASLADTSKKIGAIYVPLKLPPAEEVKAVSQWPAFKPVAMDTLICPSTMRPYLVDPRDGKHWAQRCQEVHGLKPSEGVSIHHNYIKYVNKYSKFPSLDEFLGFLYKRFCNRAVNPRNTLPVDIVAIATKALSDYEEARAAYEAKFGQAVTPELFRKLTYASISLADRQAIEDGATEAVAIAISA